MNSQNTPVHIRLWHRDFWLMAVANLLLTMSVWLLIPTMPHWLISEQGFTSLQTGFAMGAFGIGLFVFGPFVSYMVQHYRRNMVCIWSVLALGLLHAAIWYFDTELCQFVEVPILILQRFLLGAVFGLAQMVLGSTLIIDTCESYQRTEANHSAAWFARFAISLGPLAGLLVQRFFDFDIVLLAASGCACMTMVLVMMVHFPFRAPEDDIPVVSLDRFFLSQGAPLYINLLLMTVALGILLSTPLQELFYAMMMLGFLGAILAQRFAFRDAELKSEVISGLILIAAALLMMLTRTQQIVSFAAPFFVGMGVGLIGSRFLLFFIKLSRHCQRGTSQSTFFLGWESGIALGLGIGLMACYGQPKVAFIVSLTLILISLGMYQFVHNWFIRHKNR